jgi:hypothetical protein
MASIAGIITQDPVAMIQLRAVRDLALRPDLARKQVRDHLHDIGLAREPVDIDVRCWRS